MASQWPRVVDRLVQLLPTLSGWEDVVVYDGPPTRDPPPLNYATVGYSEMGEGGNYSTAQDSDGFQIDENGTIITELTFFSGSQVVSDARALMFTALDSVDAAVRADRRLGVLSQEGTSSFNVSVTPVWDGQGSAVRAQFSLIYYTVT